MSGARHAHTSHGSSDNDVGTSLDELIDRVKGLRQRTAEATLFLPAYDIRRAHEVFVIAAQHRRQLFRRMRCSVAFVYCSLRAAESLPAAVTSSGG